MKRHIVVFSVIVLVAAATVQVQAAATTDSEPRVTALALAPAALESGQRYSLLVPADDQVEGDAVPLYSGAVAKMPTNINSGQLTEWTRLPLDELPLAEADAFLERAKPCLGAIAQATRRKDCDWPAFVAGQLPSHLSEYRLLTFIVCLKARVEVARRQYEDAIGTLQMGLTMARQIGEAPTLTQSLVGIAMASVMFRGIDDLVQAPDSPNLYAALQALPRPLIDVETPIASELKALETTEYPAAVRNALREQVQPAYERIRQLARRSSSEIGARQCIEALRHFTATHEGRLPTQLSEIEGIELPDDPVTGEPYTYRVDGAEAVLQTGVPEGGRPRESMRFEIIPARRD